MYQSFNTEFKMTKLFIFITFAFYAHADIWDDIEYADENGLNIEKVKELKAIQRKEYEDSIYQEEFPDCVNTGID
jgi:hypothetical protein